MKRTQNGFTIVELMIATAVFSLVMMIIMASVLQITKMYYRVGTVAKTQEITRTITEEISESIRYSNANISTVDMLPAPNQDIPIGDTDTGYFCIGSRRYTYAVDRQLKTENPDTLLKQKAHGLWVDEPISCTVAADLNDANLTGGREMLGENMRLVKLDILDVTGTDAYQVQLIVAYGDEDLMELDDDGNKVCKVNVAGAEFCAVSSITVFAEKRL